MNSQWLNIKIEWQKLIRERMKNNNHFKILRKTKQELRVDLTPSLSDGTAETNI